MEGYWFVGVNFIFSHLTEVIYLWWNFGWLLSYYNTHTNSDSLTSSFPICIPLVSFCHLQLELQGLYWIDREKVDNLILSLILLGLLQVSLHLIWCWLLVWCILLLFCLGMVYKFLNSPKLFNKKECWILSNAFSASNEMIMWLFSLSLFI